MDEHPVRFTGDRVEVGQWSADLVALASTSAHLRQLLRDGDHTEAAALMKARCAQEQAALVAIDENPEELLSLTDMNKNGKPGYLAAVVNRLPSETVASMVAPEDARHTRFNTQILRVMSAPALSRTVDETLGPVDYHEYRSQVSWEWLEAISSLQDVNRIAEILAGLEESVLEDAFLERIDYFDMNAVVGAGGVSVTAFRGLAESAAGSFLPPIRDDVTRHVTGALFGAAPDLIKRVLRSAWERAGAL